MFNDRAKALLGPLSPELREILRKTPVGAPPAAVEPTFAVVPKEDYPPMNTAEERRAYQTRVQNEIQKARMHAGGVEGRSEAKHDAAVWFVVCIWYYKRCRRQLTAPPFPGIPEAGGRARTARGGGRGRGRGGSAGGEVGFFGLGLGGAAGCVCAAAAAAGAAATGPTLRVFSQRQFRRACLTPPPPFRAEDDRVHLGDLKATRIRFQKNFSVEAS